MIVLDIVTIRVEATTHTLAADRARSDRQRWIALFVRPIASYPRDMWLLVRALPRRTTGRFIAIPAEGHADDPRGAARRVVTQAAASISPNTYAIGSDPERDLLLLHQLVRDE